MKRQMNFLSKLNHRKLTASSFWMPKRYQPYYHYMIHHRTSASGIKQKENNKRRRTTFFLRSCNYNNTTPGAHSEEDMVLQCCVMRTWCVCNSIWIPVIIIGERNSLNEERNSLMIVDQNYAFFTWSNILVERYWKRNSYRSCPCAHRVEYC